MRRTALFFLSVFFLFTMTKIAIGSVYSDPTRPPAFPRDLPPPAAATAGKAPQVSQAHQGGEPYSVTYDLCKGWNVISFPFCQVLELKGFQRKLFRYSGGSYYAIDPVTEVTQLNTRWGYLVYADTPVKARAKGYHNRRQIRSAALEPGWNLIGCPSSKPAPWSRLAAVISSSTQLAQDAAGLPGSGNCWLSSRAYYYDRGLVSVDIKAPEMVNTPGKGIWLFAWHPLTLTVMPAPEQMQKLKIDHVTPASVAPGETVTVDGNGFYTSPAGLYLSGVPIAEQFILSWSPTRIVFRVPSYVMSGTLAVVVNGTPSNKIGLTVAEGTSGPSGTTLTGKVQDGNKTPLAGALIMLGNGMSSYSDSDGTFLIKHLPPGNYTVQGSLTGHRSAQGSINLSEGASKALLVTLTSYDEVIPAQPAIPAPERKEPKKDEQIVSEKGTLYAVAKPYYYYGKRWYVYRIEVTEWGNTSYYWHNTWYNDVGDMSFELKCPGARIGRSYNFKVEWRCRDDSKVYTNTWQRKMYRQDQRETFDTPW